MSLRIKDSIMQTLESLLRTRHGFSGNDFGPQRAEVRFNVRSGSIGRWSGPDKTPTVTMGEVVGPGDVLTIRPNATLGRRVAVYVLAVGDDGLTAMSPIGTVGFLPWQMLAYGLSHTAAVEIEDTDPETPDSDDGARLALCDEIAWLETEATLHIRLAAAAAERIDALQSELAAHDLTRSHNWLL